LVVGAEEAIAADIASGVWLEEAQVAMTKPFDRVGIQQRFISFMGNGASMGKSLNSSVVIFASSGDALISSVNIITGKLRLGNAWQLRPMALRGGRSNDGGDRDVTSSGNIADKDSNQSQHNQYRVK
jgi:hypothetical protein